MYFALITTALFIAIPLIYLIVSHVLSARLQGFRFGRNLSLLSITFTLIATEFGGELVLGTSDEAYSCGLYGILYVVGVSIGFLVLGFGFASRMKALQVSSSTDVFALKYHSPTLKRVASLLSILTLCGLLLGQVIACKSVLASLGIHSQWLFIGFWLLACLYAVTGGITGAGITNTFQLVYIIITFGGIFMYCLLKEPPSSPGLSALFDHQHLFGNSSISLSNFFTSLVMPALYCITEQDYAQPLFAARTKRISILSALSASLFMILFSLVPVYFGIKAKMLNLALPAGVSPLIPVLLILTNQTVVMLAICGIITAVIATADYLLWSLSMSISDHMLEREPIAPAHRKSLEQRIAFAVGTIVLLASYLTTSSVADVLSWSYELYDCCLVIPLLMAYFKQDDLRKSAAIGSLVAGFVGVFLFKVVSVPCPPEMAAMALSLVGYYGGIFGEHIMRRISIMRRARTMLHTGS